MCKYLRQIFGKKYKFWEKMEKKIESRKKNAISDLTSGARNKDDRHRMPG